jgi:hypothetical protein
MSMPKKYIIRELWSSRWFQTSNSHIYQRVAAERGYRYPAQRIRVTRKWAGPTTACTGPSSPSRLRFTTTWCSPFTVPFWDSRIASLRLYPSPLVLSSSPLSPSLYRIGFFLPLLLNLLVPFSFHLINKKNGKCWEMENKISNCKNFTFGK